MEVRRVHLKLGAKSDSHPAASIRFLYTCNAWLIQSAASSSRLSLYKAVQRGRLVHNSTSRMLEMQKPLLEPQYTCFGLTENNIIIIRTVFLKKNYNLMSIYNFDWCKISIALWRNPQQATKPQRSHSNPQGPGEDADLHFGVNWHWYLCFPLVFQCERWHWSEMQSIPHSTVTFDCIKVPTHPTSCFCHPSVC